MPSYTYACYHDLYMDDTTTTQHFWALKFTWYHIAYLTREWTVYSIITNKEPAKNSTSNSLMKRRDWNIRLTIYPLLSTMQGPESNSQVARENKQTIETESIPEPPPLLCAKDLSELDPYHLAKVSFQHEVRSWLRLGVGDHPSAATSTLKRRTAALSWSSWWCRIWGCSRSLLIPRWVWRSAGCWRGSGMQQWVASHLSYARRQHCLGHRAGWRTQTAAEQHRWNPLRSWRAASPGCPPEHTRPSSLMHQCKSPEGSTCCSGWHSWPAVRKLQSMRKVWQTFRIMPVREI